MWCDEKALGSVLSNYL